MPLPINYFVTEEKIRVPAITAEQMVKIDRLAMQETGPNLFQMMENAGRSLAELSLNLLGNFWAQSKIVVLTGTGGNGGGGICAARHLANRHLKVKLCVTSKEHLKEVPRWQYQIFRNTSGMDIGPEDLKEESPDLILDALIGYSLNGAPTGLPADLISWANEQTCPILSLDVPSGVDASTGETPGVYIKATWTLTLALPKTGLVREKCGQLFLADLGIPAGVYAKCGISYIPPFGNRFWVPLDWA